MKKMPLNHFWELKGSVVWGSFTKHVTPREQKCEEDSFEALIILKS